MSETVVTYQQFMYDEKYPFHIYNVAGYISNSKTRILTAHWHTEMEIAYSMYGAATHYIDGNAVENKPGKIIVVNSESIHSVIQDRGNEKLDGLAGIVILISKEYLEKMIPGYSNLYFLQPGIAGVEEKQIMEQISQYVDRHYNSTGAYGGLYLEGLIHLLFYYLMKDGIRERNQYLTINEQKNSERLRDVLSYIRNHYTEHFTQEEVAKRFYFSRSYLSRFFKENTGQGFNEYVNSYRAEQARKELLYTDCSILEIALKHGFSDSRGFINIFKKMYGITPLQFRKQYSPVADRDRFL